MNWIQLLKLIERPSEQESYPASYYSGMHNGQTDSVPGICDRMIGPIFWKKKLKSKITDILSRIFTFLLWILIEKPNKACFPTELTIISTVINAFAK